LDFKSPTDRLLIGVLKELKFLDADGVPTKRYFEFLDGAQSKKVLAAAIRDAYADLFAVQLDANKLSTQEAKNKLRTLYAGSKTDTIIMRIARTFTALCEYADWSSPPAAASQGADKPKDKEEETKTPASKPPEPPPSSKKSVHLASLQYHINIVLPESRDQAVYDAIFKSLREHLG